MIEKKIESSENNNQNPFKERFEFILTVNGQIACQRYFRINGFKKDSFNSIEFKETIDRCVELIKNDLASKSRMYLWLTAPHVFKNEDAMNDWLEKRPSVISAPSYVIMQENENVYVWDGEKMEPYNGYFNRADYIRGEDEQEFELKFSVYDDGKEVISKVFSGNDYPRFIRANIDLTNQKNRYDDPENFSIIESSLIKHINMYDETTHKYKRKDLVSIIVREICQCCSGFNTEAFTTKEKYGDKEYNFNISAMNNQYIYNMARKYRKKTEVYEKSLVYLG